VAAKQAGWRANHKRIHRLWIAEGLRVPYRKRKKPLRGIGQAVGARCPIRPNVDPCPTIEKLAVRSRQTPSKAHRPTSKIM
jgi:hypothetical protein